MEEGNWEGGGGKINERGSKLESIRKFTQIGTNGICFSVSSNFNLQTVGHTQKHKPHMGTDKWKPEVDFGCLPLSLFTLYIETKSLIQFAISACLASQLTPEILCGVPPPVTP